MGKRQKVGPTSYATRQINETKLSAFFMIFDLSMINFILNCTNCHAKAVDPQFSFTKEDILAFIGLLYARGVLCPNVPLKAILVMFFDLNKFLFICLLTQPHPAQTSIYQGQKFNKTTFIGTVRKNKKELPTSVKEQSSLYDSQLYENGKGCTLSVYQGRKDKNVAVFT
ncbi:piggyBac transposable element-derived 4-like isoform X1 [Brachionus plicatilis]|uniref:PiggyBac transposable element-derived 4-like isoform X1 n=1 Tax=Brachionus plicatilis TaxID=10195 RepID=A0A3M7PUA1_BRAPC|nr:piggyBac transposable element-derived 4-like isoform X1 [Brachionus plicatilis]